MNKKTIADLGRTMAEQLHNCATIEQRGAIIEAKDAISDCMTWADGVVFQRAYRETLDKLEPLPSPR